MMYFRQQRVQHSSFNVKWRIVNSSIKYNLLDCVLYAESVGKFQPRVCFETLGKCVSLIEYATLKELRRRPWSYTPSQLFQSCDRSSEVNFDPGLQSQPWAGIRDRFQRWNAWAGGTFQGSQERNPFVIGHLTFVISGRAMSTLITIVDERVQCSHPMTNVKRQMSNVN